ncbi:MAG: DUF1659 domain-containing protein [Veillonella sp.]|nr:DUF1659 domain-containing protein [Veillonella sp.]MCF0155734.1 DUF1659 domain-containing protein [Veillonella sp.]
MANRTVNMTKLVLRLNDGVGANNQPKYKDVTYTRIAESASDEALQAAGQALASLQTKPVAHVIRVDEIILG